MAKKNVTVFVVDYVGIDSFTEVLLNPTFHSPVEIDDYKTSELKFVQQNSNGTLTGLFVTTQRKGLPPAHTPGEDDDFTAIPLDEGQGLAYPNTILYDPRTNTMYIETNRAGLNDKKICEYFKRHAIAQRVDQFSISLALVLKSEAYERVNNMVFIESMECKVANPLQFVRNELQEGALRDFKELASQLNATKAVSLIVKSEEVQGGVTKREALKFISFFSRIVTGTTFDRKNKLIIKGRKRGDSTEHEELIQEDVNFFLNKIQGSFSLDEPNVASHVQAIDRKRGITEVYEQYHDEITHIIGYV